jgi:hypothetical protein
LDRHSSSPVAGQGGVIETFANEGTVVIPKLEQLAAARRRTLREVLNLLSVIVPDFVAIVSASTRRE